MGNGVQEPNTDKDKQTKNLTAQQEPAEQTSNAAQPKDKDAVARQASESETSQDAGASKPETSAKTAAAKGTPSKNGKKKTSKRFGGAAAGSQGSAAQPAGQGAQKGTPKNSQGAQPSSQGVPPKRPPSQAEPAAKGPRVWPLWVAVVALGGALAGGGYLGWQQWQRLDQLESELAQQQGWQAPLQSTRADLQRARQQLQTQGQQLQQQSQQQQQLDQQLAEVLRQVAAKDEASPKDWRLAEAEYLLRIANQRLLMEEDVGGALALLQAADNSLLEADDASLFFVRKAVAQDIARLQAVPNIDQEGIFLRLAALAEQVDKLPLKTEPRLTRAEVTETAASDTDDWQQRMSSMLASAWQRFTSLVVIRRSEDRIEPLLPPEQHYYLQQNLRLMLEQAQLALLQREAELYRQSLTKAQQWIAAYFDAEATASQAMRAQLEQLAGLSIAPQLPSIAGSLEALKSHLNAKYAATQRITPATGNAAADSEEAVQ